MGPPEGSGIRSVTALILGNAGWQRKRALIPRFQRFRRILDGDVSQVKEFKDNTPHPGKDRTSGHFGFAGHNDPVEFRSFKVKSTPE